MERAEKTFPLVPALPGDDFIPLQVALDHCISCLGKQQSHHVEEVAVGTVARSQGYTAWEITWASTRVCLCTWFNMQSSPSQKL